MYAYVYKLAIVHAYMYAYMCIYVCTLVGGSGKGWVCVYLGL